MLTMITSTVGNIVTQRCWTLAIIAIAAFAAPVSAGCNDLTVIGGTSPIVPGKFNPFAAADTIEIPAGIVISNSGSGPCNASVSFFGTASGPVMGTVNQLQYSIETTGGSSIYTTGVSPGAGQRIATTVPANSSVTVSYRIRIPIGGANALVAPGLRGDTQTFVRVYKTSNLSLLADHTFSAQAEVDAVCVLPTPTATSLDFSSAISQGIANAGMVLTSNFSGIKCNNPASLTLEGDALRRTPAGSAPSGFDNFINFRAVSNFDGASADLTTTSALGVDTITSLSTSNGATASGGMTVSVNLIAGNTALAGSYSSVLTVRLTPVP